MAATGMGTGRARGHRVSRRLASYGYFQAGAYFVTICAKDRACLFGTVLDGHMLLNEVGIAISAIWRAIPEHFQDVTVDEFVIMPNHVHGILVFAATLPTEGAMNRAPTLGNVVRATKARATRALGLPIWQRNYHDHIIRDAASLDRIRQYIRDNPARWAEDDQNPETVGAPFIAP